jgi:hypothetical protein
MLEFELHRDRILVLKQNCFKTNFIR